MMKAVVLSMLVAVAEGFARNALGSAAATRTSALGPRSLLKPVPSSTALSVANGMDPEEGSRMRRELAKTRDINHIFIQNKAWR
eukprot:scaffold651_cov252-Pinguiococcus_pyrenoidosus.AAC.7